jgi:hypothetical protein
MRSVRLQQKSEFFLPIYRRATFRERFEEAFLHMGRQKRRDENRVRISNYVLIRKIIQQKERAPKKFKKKYVLKHKNNAFK